ncbi:MAG: hypothetical protein AB7G87_10695 [Clostridia bacterium]
MSLFLGKIHYWLYNKIVWLEVIEEEIIRWAKEVNLPIEEWIQQVYSEYGMPTGNKSLEEIIDTSNIHGWLQDRIASAEARQAALITRIIGENSEYKNDLLSLFSKQGAVAASKYEGEINMPEDAYNALNDYILEGMPCDRVNELLENNEKEFIWQTSICLHKPYWEKVSGDVQNFYILREAWIKSFIETIKPDFRFVKVADNIQKIERR